jgi:hypothetical protein
MVKVFNKKIPHLNLLSHNRSYIEFQQQIWNVNQFYLFFHFVTFQLNNQSIFFNFKSPLHLTNEFFYP